MSRELNLSEEDLLVLQKCLNDGVEPPQALSKKLFPSIYASYDFKILKDSRIPTIECEANPHRFLGDFHSILVKWMRFSAPGGSAWLKAGRRKAGGEINLVNNVPQDGMRYLTA